LTEIALDLVLGGDWKEARRITDELIPGFEESPFWIEPQTRVCRARMLIAEGALPEALDDADRAVEVVRTSHAFQTMCDPLALRALLHAEAGEHRQAGELVDQLLDLWTARRSGYVIWWLLDLWYAATATGREERLQAVVDAYRVFPWAEIATALNRRDFDSAVAQLERMPAPLYAALVRMWGAEWLVAEGRDASSQLERSLQFWRDVGAQRYADRCESLMAPRTSLTGQ
jgi:hypothetical protein